MEEGNHMKGRVCVTGGTGFVGSWMVKKLLENGYSVNATVRIDTERKRDISYLTNLPGASERLQVFEADLDRPDSFAPAIQGCDGVFHTAHPHDYDGKEAEEEEIKRVTNATIGILQACIDSKTVKRVVYTSSVITVSFNRQAIGLGIVDERSWSDVDVLPSLGAYAGSYMVTKTLVEKTALDFAEKHGLDLVTVLPSMIHGPFLGPRCPDSISISMALIFGDIKIYQGIKSASFVHIDDVARAQIHLFECPKAKGRYICSAAEITIEKLHEFISTRYPEFKLPTIESLTNLTRFNSPSLSSKKLLETGFQYENGFEEMFDGAIKRCKDVGLL